MGLPRVATVQNPYCLINRSLENGLDETMPPAWRVDLLAYSPLAFGLLTGKYDATGLVGDAGRMSQVRDPCASSAGAARKRWTPARRYNALARDHGLTPSQLALAFCYTQLAAWPAPSSA
jgi:aryl-alcohol dehydrogenase-like predicted oxidoreductase